MKVKGLNSCNRDRSLGFYKPWNFLTTLQPSVWTEKHEILGCERRVGLRDYGVVGGGRVRVGACWPGNKKS